MTTTLREAATQALEALDACSWEQVYATRGALRAALAEPVQAAGEYRVMVCGVDCHLGDQNCNGYCTGQTDDPPTATAEQSAVFAAQQNLERPSCDECGKSKDAGWALYCVKCAEKVFTAPPQRKPLTDEEIKDAVLSDPIYGAALMSLMRDDLTVASLRQAIAGIARAIEAKHGIGGKT